MAAPSADLQVMVQEKLRELERDPENVQLVINEISDGLKSLQVGMRLLCRNNFGNNRL